MKTRIDTLRKVLPGCSEADLHLPLREPGTHLLDAIIIRDTLERHFGIEIPEDDWQSLSTLSDALAYCDREAPERRHYVAAPPIDLTRKYEICLPQMANGGLSENWLLKEMGDMHWEMLSRGLEQKSSRFADAAGNRLYAAFVRVRYSLAALHRFSENEQLQLSSSLSRAGDYTYLSQLEGDCADKHITAELMTSFSARRQNDNARMQPGRPSHTTNNIKELGYIPGFQIEHRLMGKGRLAELETMGQTFRITSRALETLVHTINPYFEINGAGLFYFASYPIVADMCTAAFFGNTLPGHDYYRTYHTTFRDVCYFANCNAGDRIIAQLNSIEHISSNHISTATSLYRESDGKLMARIFTIKEKCLDLKEHL